MANIQEELKVKADRFKARAKETDDPKARERAEKIAEDTEAKLTDQEAQQQEG